MSINNDFETSLEWRIDRWKDNLADLYEATSPNALDPFNALPNLVLDLKPDSSISALRWSILTLWLESAYCYVLGQFQACILASGAGVERILKLEFQEQHDALPEGNWTLGRCVYDLDFSNTRITEDVLAHARECIDPKNDRSHALLEHKNPNASMIGGDRGMHEISSNRYLIEPYRGEARIILGNTWLILNNLYI